MLLSKLPSVYRRVAPTFFSSIHPRQFSENSERSGLVHFTWEDLVSLKIQKDKDNKNVLTSSKEVLDLALAHFPDTLNISTLVNVCESAELFHQIAKCKFDFQRDYKITFKDFQFKDRIWTMSKSLLKTEYNDKEYQIINFKLPNDGFIYSSVYGAGMRNKVNRDLPEVASFLQKFVDSVDKIPKFTPTLHVNYRQQSGRFELYFDDKVSQLLTVKFEYGNHKSYIQDPPETLEEWKMILLASQKKAQIQPN